MFNTWIKAKRESKRLTQTECAARVGISQEGWRKYEAETTQPRRATVEKIAFGLDVPLNEALEAAGLIAKEQPSDRVCRLAKALAMRLNDISDKEFDHLLPILAQDADKYRSLMTYSNAA